MKPRHVPLRTCIGCSERYPKRELLRVVRTPEGEVLFDPTGKRSGRGTYLCPKADCLERAVRTKSLERALKQPVSTQEAESLRESLKPLVQEGTRGQDR